MELFGHGEKVAELPEVGSVHMKSISTVGVLNIGHIEGVVRIVWA
jgi:hypothetical protein